MAKRHVKGRKGRPPQYYKTASGRTIIGMSMRADGKFYATHSKQETGKVRYLGTDEVEAERRLKQYYAELNEDKTQITLPQEKTGITHVGYVDWDEIPLPVIENIFAGDTFEVPSEALWAALRKMVVEAGAQETAARLGIPRFASLKDEDVAGIHPSYKLKDLGQDYIANCTKRNVSKNEISNTRLFWNEFCKIVRVAQVGRITETTIKGYADRILDEFYKKDRSRDYVRHRFRKVISILIYAKNNKPNKSEIRAVLEYCASHLKVPRKAPKGKPYAFTKEEFHRLLQFANPTYRAFFLLALNTAFNPVDLIRIPKSSIYLETGILNYPRVKTDQLFARVAILWQETIDALNIYRNDIRKESGCETFFASKYARPYSRGYIAEGFRQIKQEAQLPHIEFRHFRNSSLSAMIGQCEGEVIDVVMGHGIKGEKKKYYDLKPELVKPAMDAIYAKYFC